jgi:hypothetical protein
MRVDKTAWTKWQRWVVRIQLDLQTTVNDQAQYDVFRDVVVENAEWIGSNDGAGFVYLVRSSFRAHAFMAIRRLVKEKDDAVSLVGLLSQVAEQAHQLTYGRYLDFNPIIDPTIHEWQRDAFGKLSEDGLVVSRGLVEADRNRAKQLSASAEEIADREIAHLDPRGPEAKATFDELRDCLYLFDELAVKYVRFFTGISFHDNSLKIRLPFDPRRVFRYPLIKPDEA